MNRMELGVYILGATALVILAAAGVAMGKDHVITAAVLASGAAYVSQLCGAIFVANGGRAAHMANGVFMLAAFGAWAFGVYALLT